MSPCWYGVLCRYGASCFYIMQGSLSCMNICTASVRVPCSVGDPCLWGHLRPCLYKAVYHVGDPCLKKLHSVCKDPCLQRAPNCLQGSHICKSACWTYCRNYTSSIGVPCCRSPLSVGSLCLYIGAIFCRDPLSAWALVFMGSLPICMRPFFMRPMRKRMEIY